MWFSLFLLQVYIAIVINGVNNEDDFCDSACGLVALVPARGGSKGIPNKNVALLDNQTLVFRTVSILNSSNVFETIWVSTDLDIIAREAEKAGAKVHWRAPDTATDSASTLSVVQDFLAYHPGVRTVAVIQCTSPFLCPSWLAEASSILEDNQIDCVFSVTRSHKLRWNLGPDGLAKPANFDPLMRPRRQDWDGELHETGMFYFFRRDLVRAGALQNDKCKVVEVPVSRSLEIDSPMDLLATRALLPLMPPCSN